jgi:cytidine deaminase
VRALQAGHARLHPDIVIAVPGADGPTVRAVRDLLPEAYFFPDVNARRIVRFNQRYYEAVKDGTKRSSVRWNEAVTVGPAIFVFEDHPESAALDGRVVSVTRHPLASLTPQQARLADSTDMAEYRDGLRRHYPDLPSDADVDVVAFELATDGPPSPRG